MSENPRDGRLDRLVFRRLSRPVTRRLLPTSLTPNAVTGIGVGLGIAGAFSLTLPWPLGAGVGVVLLACANVLDCCDGELARVRGAESRLGHVLDVTGDVVVNGALLVALTRVVGRAGRGPDRDTLVLLALGVLGSFAAITWSETSEARRQRVACWENRVLDEVLGPLTTRDWWVFPIGFGLAGRLDALLPAAAVGAQVFWILVAVLVTRVLRRSSARNRQDHDQGRAARVVQ